MSHKRHASEKPPKHHLFKGEGQFEPENTPSKNTMLPITPQKNGWRKGLRKARTVYSMTDKIIHVFGLILIAGYGITLGTKHGMEMTLFAGGILLLGAVFYFIRGGQ